MRVRVCMRARTCMCCVCMPVPGLEEGFEKVSVWAVVQLIAMPEPEGTPFPPRGVPACQQPFSSKAGWMVMVFFVFGGAKMGKSGNNKNGSENGLPGQIFGHCLIFFFAQLTDFWAFNGAFFCVYLVQPSVAPSSSWGSATMEIPEQLLLFPQSQRKFIQPTTIPKPRQTGWQAAGLPVAGVLMDVCKRSMGSSKRGQGGSSTHDAFVGFPARDNALVALITFLSLAVRKSST